MAGQETGWQRVWRAPFWQGWLLLVLLITLFLGKPLFTNQPLLAADLLFYLDPLWQPLAPPNFNGPANQVLSDQVFEFYPWQKFARGEFAAGRLPLWNPYVNSGHPFLANAQSALFDPFNLIALLWPLTKSFVVVAFLRLLCAGTFTLLLALELGMSRGAAVLAMIVFTFGGPQVVWLLYPKASVLVWLPALLFFSARLIRTGNWRYGAGVGLVLGAQLVGGHPETALYSALLWLIFSGYWLWLAIAAQGLAAQGLATQGRWIVRPRLVQLMVAGLLGVGAGAVQWLPTAEALLHSEILAARTQSALTWQSVFFQWRDWLAAVTMLMPGFFGNPSHQSYWNPFSNYTEQTIFVGVLPLVLALLVLLSKGKTRQMLFFTVLAVITLGLALRLPGFPLLGELPILNVTNPNRLRSVYMLAIALLAGYGLEMVRRSLLDDAPALHGYRVMTRLFSAFAVAIFVIGTGAFVLIMYFQDQLVELGRVQAQAGQNNPFFFRPLEAYLLLADARVVQMLWSFFPANPGMYSSFYLAPFFAYSGRMVLQRIRAPYRRTQVISGLVLAVVTFELFYAHLNYNPTLAPELVYPTPPLVATLLEEDPPATGEPYRVVGTNLTLVPNVSMVFGLQDVRGYDPIAPARYMAVMGGLAGNVRVGHHLLFREVDAPFLDFLNVRYVFTPDTLGERWELIATEKEVNLYANQTALPRAFMVYASDVASDRAESLAMTVAPDFDFRNRVVLEGDVAPMTGLPPGLAPTVEMVEYLPGTLTVEVASAVDGLLVVSDPYAPGWVASVDGVATEILIANHAFRAVRIPAGNHTVIFEYRPLSVRVGAWSSGVSLIILIVLLAVKMPSYRAQG